MELPGGPFKFELPYNQVEFVGQETLEAVKVLANYLMGNICSENKSSDDYNIFNQPFMKILDCVWNWPT